MKAAEDGNITTLESLIHNKEIDINTRGPKNYTWVSSWSYSS